MTSTVTFCIIECKGHHKTLKETYEEQGRNLVHDYLCIWQCTYSFVIPFQIQQGITNERCTDNSCNVYMDNLGYSLYSSVLDV